MPAEIVFHNPLQLLLDVFRQGWPDISVTVAYSRLPDGYAGLVEKRSDDAPFYIFLNPDCSMQDNVATLGHELAHVIEATTFPERLKAPQERGDIDEHTQEWRDVHDLLSRAYRDALQRVDQPHFEGYDMDVSGDDCVLDVSPPAKVWPQMEMQHRHGGRYMVIAHEIKGAGALRGDTAFVYQGENGQDYVRLMSAWEQERHDFKLVVKAGNGEGSAGASEEMA